VPKTVVRQCRIMPVLNRIGKIRKRNHALVTFDPAKILRAIKRGADSAGGFAPDYLPEINEKIFAAVLLTLSSFA